MLMIGTSELASIIYVAWSDNVRPKDQPVVPWDYLPAEQKRAWKEVAAITGFKIADAMGTS